MEVKGGIFLLLLCLCVGTINASWSILDYMSGNREKLDMSLKTYCESWKLNVELHNIRDYESVPGECVEFISKYMSSSQYKTDVQSAADEALLFLANTFVLGRDGKDAWVFDVDDTLLSNLVYFKKIDFGAVLGCSGKEGNRTTLENWMFESKAPAIEQIRDLFHAVRARGLKIFIVSSRKEYLRDSTVKNLFNAGYHGWSGLILRCDYDGFDRVMEYKAEQRKKLISQGYRLWGIVGDQWSSVSGHPHTKRTFKIPNPMYYVS